MDESIDTRGELVNPLVDDTIATTLNAQTIALSVLAILAVFYALQMAAELVVPILLAIMLKLMLQPAMRFLCARLKFPMSVAALVLIVGLLGVIGGIGVAIAVPASGWIAKAPQGLQTLEDQLSRLRDPIEAAQQLLQRAEHLATPAGTPAAVAAAPTAPAIGLGKVGVSVLVLTQQFFGRFFVVAVTLFFLLAAGDSMLRKLVEATPRFEGKKHVVYIMNEIERNISRYLATITMINLGVGAVVGVVVYFCGIADPLLWGTIAFLLNYIPIVGPLIGIGIIFIVGLLTFGHVGSAMVPSLFYLVAHLVEGQIVTPLLLSRRFTLSPVIVVLSLFFWHWLWGIQGALLSVPLLATIKIICDRIPSLAPLGHMLGAPSQLSHSGQ